MQLGAPPQDRPARHGDDLAAVGVALPCSRPDRPRGLAGRGRHRAVAEAYEAFRRDSVLPSTWEVITAMAWGPPPGTARREAGADIATFPADRLAIRRR